MDIKAKTGVEFNNHIYRKGEVCRNYNGEIDQRIADNFTDVDDNPLMVGGGVVVGGGDSAVQAVDETQAKIAKCIEVMRREGIMQALDGMGITYAPKARTDYLAKLLLMNKGEIEE